MSNQYEPNPITAAVKYLEFAWNQALWSQEAIVYKSIGHRALDLIEEIESSEDIDLTAAQISDIESWKTNVVRLLEGYESEYLTITRSNAEQELYVKYANAILYKGLLIYSKPSFFINCTESVERLAIQKKYDTQREALLMTNDEAKMSFSDVEALRKVDGRKIYRGCVLTDNHLSIDAELRELNNVGDAVNQRKAWLPDVIANLVGMSTAGVPFGEEDSWEWDEYFMNLGYKRAEELAQDSLPAPVQTPQQLSQRPNPRPGPGPANALPPSSHGRPNPFRPTQQPTLTSKEGVKTKYKKTKGNPPGDVDFFEYDLAYNRADSRGRHSGKTLQMRGRDRNSGETRDAAIDDLISKGLLPAGFQDLNP
ncbi:hypothetical protein ACEPPN_009130 [Leptodophora sp. 'Broadleaf-Isolate-01']